MITVLNVVLEKCLVPVLRCLMYLFDVFEYINIDDDYSVVRSSFLELYLGHLQSESGSSHVRVTAGLSRFDLNHIVLSELYLKIFFVALAVKARKIKILPTKLSLHSDG